MEILNDSNKNVLDLVQGWLGLSIHALLFMLTQKGKERDTGILSYFIYQVVRLG